MIKGMKIYKYSNRKYYVATKETPAYKPGYVDLKDILEFTKNNVIYTVIDYKTKNDVTADTLFDAVHEHLKGKVPQHVLQELVHENYSS